MESKQAIANEILKWLDDGGAEIHTRPGSERLPGPLEWILKTSQFQDWLSDGPQTLLLVGRPGSGKTTAASLIVDTLLRQDKPAHRIGVAFLHVGVGEDKRNAMQLSRSLLYQLGQQLASSFISPLDPTRMEYLLDPLREKSPYSNMNDMVSRILPHIVGEFGRVYVVVDELDQMTGHRDPLRSSLISLAEKNFRLLFTTCHNPDADGRLRGALQIHICGATVEGDLDTYVTQRLVDLPRFAQNRLKMQDFVKERVIEDANGLIFAAKLLMDGLMNIRGARIKSKLESSTEDILEPLYKRFIMRVHKLDEADQNFAKETLAWLLLVRRPMREAEMRHILRREDEASTLDPDDAPNHEYFLELCMDFNILPYTESSIRFDILQPASNYLLRTLDVWCPNAKTIIATRCLQYLVLDEFAKGPCKTDADLELRLENYPLYEYMARHWADHLRDLPELPVELVRSFVKDHTKVASASQVMSVPDQKPPQPGYSQRFELPGSGIHLAAQLGLTSVLACLLEEKQMLAKTDAKGRTPLWCATENNRQETMKLLSRVDRKTFTLLLDKTQIPLAHALIQAAGTDIRDLRSSTALHIGVIRNDLDIMRLSLESGINIHAKDLNGRSAIQLAIQRDLSDAVDLLLEHSASTAHISANFWLRAFGKWDDSKYPQPRDYIIQLVEKDLEKKSVSFLPMKTFKLVDHPISDTTRRLLIYPDPEQGPRRESNQFSKPSGNSMFRIIQFSHAALPRDHQGPHFLVEAAAPSQDLPGRDMLFRRTWKTLKISWSIEIRPDPSGNDRWVSIDHGSTLRNGSMPSSGMALLDDLVIELTSDWLEFCNRIDHHLLQCRLDILRVNGESRDLINRLLMDATTWISLRRHHHEQIRAARDFCQEYQDHAYEDKVSGVVASTIDRFASIVESRFDKFDADSSALIQLEFNLTSIREAQKSTSLNISMKRLSWITFIFLPLVFVSGLLGMNVDILENNPPWWWYLVFMFVTLSLTMFVWIFFRKFPHLEDKVDTRFSWLKPRTVDRQNEDVESVSFFQLKKKVN